jgi:membrane-associated phospholipid phosphatase
MKPLRRRASSFDAAIRMLSQSANKGLIWLVMAAVGAMVPGRTRRAAIRATGSLAATSIVVNAVVKPLSRRGRPDIMLTPLYRRLTRQPWSTSFPSGHAPSAAAFAAGVGLEYPAAGRRSPR